MWVEKLDVVNCIISKLGTIAGRDLVGFTCSLSIGVKEEKLILYKDLEMFLVPTLRINVKLKLSHD